MIHARKIPNEKAPKTQEWDRSDTLEIYAMRIAIC